MPIDPGQGSYIPFPDPIDAIVTDSQLPPLNCVRFNAAWQPHVLGAIKALTRPETYRGSSVDIEAAVQGGQDILASLGELCVPNSPQFYLAQNLVYCPDLGVSQTLRPTANCQSDQTNVFFTVGYWDAIANKARVGLECHDLLDDVLCGGHICFMRAWWFASATNLTWRLQWRDCNDVDHEDVLSVNDPEYLFSDFQAQKICLNAESILGNTLSGIAAIWIIDGPVLCRFP